MEYSAHVLYEVYSAQNINRWSNKVRLCCKIMLIAMYCKNHFINFRAIYSQLEECIF